MLSEIIRGNITFKEKKPAANCPGLIQSVTQSRGNGDKEGSLPQITWPARGRGSGLGWMAKVVTANPQPMLSLPQGFLRAASVCIQGG